MEDDSARLVVDKRGREAIGMDFDGGEMAEKEGDGWLEDLRDGLGSLVGERCPSVMSSSSDLPKLVGVSVLPGGVLRRSSERRNCSAYDDALGGTDVSVEATTDGEVDCLRSVVGDDLLASFLLANSPNTAILGDC